MRLFGSLVAFLFCFCVFLTGCPSGPEVKAGMYSLDREIHPTNELIMENFLVGLVPPGVPSPTGLKPVDGSESPPHFFIGVEGGVEIVEQELYYNHKKVPLQRTGELINGYARFECSSDAWEYLLSGGVVAANFQDKSGRFLYLDEHTFTAQGTGEKMAFRYREGWVICESQKRAGGHCLAFGYVKD